MNIINISLISNDVIYQNGVFYAASDNWITQNATSSWVVI